MLVYNAGIKVNSADNTHWIRYY